MFNNFYGFLADQKLHQLNLFNYLNIAETYGRIREAKEVFDPKEGIIENSSMSYFTRTCFFSSPSMLK